MSPKQKVPKGGLEKLGHMTNTGLPNYDYKSKEKHRKVPNITCAKRIK